MRVSLLADYLFQTDDTPLRVRAYQDFFTLWRDADPDIPVFIAAKAEYDKMK